MAQKSTDREVVETTNTPDYANVTIPAKPPSDLSYVQRRAELLGQIMSLGHPSMIHQGEMAERYDVSQSQISKDINRLAEYIDENLGSRRELTTEAVYQRCITGLLEEGEYYKAASAVGEWNEWITNHKDLQELAEQVDQLEREHHDEQPDPTRVTATLSDLKEQLGECEDAPEDLTDLWRAFIEGELTLEEWKQSVRQ